MNLYANSERHVAFCHQLNRALKGYIKFNEVSCCLLTGVTFLSFQLRALSPPASLHSAAWEAFFVTLKTSHSCLLNGDTTASVDGVVNPSLSHRCFLFSAASWILTERKRAHSGLSLWQPCDDDDEQNRGRWLSPVPFGREMFGLIFNLVSEPHQGSDL